MKLPHAVILEEEPVARVKLSIVLAAQAQTGIVPTFLAQVRVAIELHRNAVC